MKEIYNDLNALNTDLITEYKIRCQNHMDLVESLKQVNIIIQRAGNLRGKLGHIFKIDIKINKQFFSKNSGKIKITIN